MTFPSKLFLYSMSVADEHWRALDAMTGKARHYIRMGMILNAMDVVPGAAPWVSGMVDAMAARGYRIRRIDLKEYLHPVGPSMEMDDLDIIWVSGGHTYYLRWIMGESGADIAIRKFVRQGGVYAGWSAGAIVAGPSLHYFDRMGDDPKDVPGVIYEGLGLTDKVIVPHVDHPMFKKGAVQVIERQLGDGRKPVPLRDDEVIFLP